MEGMKPDADESTPLSLRVSPTLKWQLEQAAGQLTLERARTVHQAETIRILLDEALTKRDITLEKATLMAKDAIKQFLRNNSEALRANDGCFTNRTLHEGILKEAKAFFYFLQLDAALKSLETENYVRHVGFEVDKGKKKKPAKIWEVVESH